MRILLTWSASDMRYSFDFWFNLFEKKFNSHFKIFFSSKNSLIENLIIVHVSENIFNREIELSSKSFSLWTQLLSWELSSEILCQKVLKWENLWMRLFVMKFVIMREFFFIEIIWLKLRLCLSHSELLSSENLITIMFSIKEIIRKTFHMLQKKKKMLNLFH